MHESSLKFAILDFVNGWGQGKFRRRYWLAYKTRKHKTLYFSLFCAENDVSVTWFQFERMSSRSLMTLVLSRCLDVLDALSRIIRSRGPDLVARVKGRRNKFSIPYGYAVTIRFSVWTLFRSLFFLRIYWLATYFMVSQSITIKFLMRNQMCLLLWNSIRLQIPTYLKVSNFT